MNNRLPYGLEKLLMWISADNNVQSWRYTVENNPVLSIKFKPMQDNGNAYSSQVADDIPKCYRTKSPGTIVRDSYRQQKWISEQEQRNFACANEFSDSTRIYRRA